MNAIVDWFTAIPPDILTRVARIAGILFAGLVVGRLILFLLTKTLGRRMTEHGRHLLRNAVVYTAAVFVGFGVVGELGFDLTTLLGAAGIVGIAVGFASQTSVSNIISGLFLVSEKPFVVGDIITVENKTGIVMSIDLLSIKLRTFDNLFVRVPNQVMLNTQVVNITRFPIRRMDIKVSVAYKEDIGKVRKTLLEAASKNPYALAEPEPFLMVNDFGASGLEFLFGVWFVKTDFVALRNSIMQEIKERFDAEGIEIPFPHRSVYTGEASKPFPIRIVNEAPKRSRQT